jgi:hypothetical protein
LIYFDVLKVTELKIVKFIKYFVSRIAVVFCRVGGGCIPNLFSMDIFAHPLEKVKGSRSPTLASNLWDLR